MYLVSPGASEESVVVKSEYNPCGPSGPSLSRFLSHEVTRSISTPPLDGMPVHSRVTPSIRIAYTYLYTWVERGNVRVKCLAQEHNTMSLASALARTSRSGDEPTNHDASLKRHSQSDAHNFLLLLLGTYRSHAT